MIRALMMRLTTLKDKDKDKTKAKEWEIAEAEEKGKEKLEMEVLFGQKKQFLNCFMNGEV